MRRSWVAGAISCALLGCSRPTRLASGPRDGGRAASRAGRRRPAAQPCEQPSTVAITDPKPSCRSAPATLVAPKMAASSHRLSHLPARLWGNPKQRVSHYCVYS